MTATLEHKGFDVVAAASVTEALRFITAESFDVLITDLHMPNPMITHLRGALKAQVLKSHLAVEDLKRILSIAYERHPKWTIFIDKIASKSHFLLYAARYVRRPPLASWRFLEVTDREVVFVAKDTKTKRLVPTSCQLSDFVRLLTPHVPDSYRHSVILAFCRHVHEGGCKLPCSPCSANA
jgi:CheY-like chemotaxis protein